MRKLVCSVERIYAVFRLGNGLTNTDFVPDAEVMRTLLEQEGLTGTGWKERDEWVAAAEAREAAAGKNEQ